MCWLVGSGSLEAISMVNFKTILVLVLVLALVLVYGYQFHRYWCLVINTNTKTKTYTNSNPIGFFVFSSMFTFTQFAYFVSLDAFLG